MGLLLDLTSATPMGSATDAGPLRDLISAMVTADGSVDVAEHATVEALHESVPQLRAAPQSARPPAAGRKGLLAAFAKIDDARLRKQLFVLAVDLALASDGACAREDVFVEELRQVLKIDDAFARQTSQVIAIKYARNR